MFFKINHKKKYKDLSIKTINTIKGRMENSRPNGFIIGRDDNVTSFFVANEVKELLSQFNDVQVLLIDDEKRYNDLVKDLGGEIIEFKEQNSFYEYYEMFELYIGKKLETDNRLILFDINYPAYWNTGFNVFWLNDLLSAIAKCYPKQDKRWIYANRLDEIFCLGEDCIQTLWEHEKIVMTSIINNPSCIFEYETSRDTYKYPNLTETFLKNSGFYLLIDTNIHNCELTKYLVFENNMLGVLTGKKFGLVTYDGSNLSIFEVT